MQNKYKNTIHLLTNQNRAIILRCYYSRSKEVRIKLESVNHNRYGTK